MYISPEEIKNTKIMVPRGDCNAVQNALFKCGYGYLQGLSLNKTLIKYKSETAFYINYAGEIEAVSKDEYEDEMHFYTDFKEQLEIEIKWESLF